MRRIPVYNHPAAGWPALGSSLRKLVFQRDVMRGSLALSRSNQPQYGFDCPGCAWPDHKTYKPIDICENGIKAVASETTQRRADAAFFAQHPVRELRLWQPQALEEAGRLVSPMRYDAKQDRWVNVEWNDALDDIANQLKRIQPNRASFYTSGRTSNEAAFIYQMMVRLYGTNNLPDCSNMCHEPTSVVLEKQIGIGKSTVRVEDFEHAKLILMFGQNPASNHPRMLETLAYAHKQGCRIVAINPVREAGLKRFANPQKPQDMLLGHASEVVSNYIQVKIGGDCALLTGLCKWLVQEQAIDQSFIAHYTSHFDQFCNWLDQQQWQDIEQQSGIKQDQIAQLARWYSESTATICTWGMGITQHTAGEDNVAMITNLLLLQGNIGKRGAGTSPIRGHSNVQGDRTMGIHHDPKPELMDGLQKLVEKPLPRDKGLDVVKTAQAIIEGKIDALIGLGGNFATAIPQPDTVRQAMAKLKLSVQIGTKLNETMLYPAQTAYLLPCLGRTEADQKRTGRQRVTIEDSMCQITPSQGHLQPASSALRSEVDILCELAYRLVGKQPSLDWLSLKEDYSQIRDCIARSISGFEDFNTQLAQRPRGFYLDNPARRRRFKTDSQKAQFICPQQSIRCHADSTTQSNLMTWQLTSLRSHDQFNTTVYGVQDRYRATTRRDVLFMHPDAIQANGWQVGQAVMVERTDQQAQHGPLILQPLDLAQQCIAVYYPECNGLFRLDEHAPESGTPTYKSLAVHVTAA